MRGFRASRAAVNFKSARFGNQPNPFQPKLINGGFHQQEQPQQKRELPEWLRIPVTESNPEVSKLKTAKKKVASLAKAKTKSKRVAKSPSKKKKMAA